ncbi:MAG: cytochrome c oxidase subunit I, partial [Desulforhopalus sp.]|nr:cytochrome c oxidase subunit I [Desulforhopalus sp.]
GGLTGLVIGAVGPNIHVHDTQFIVAHFHFVMFGGTGFAFFAALHFWWPKMFGIMYRFKPAYIGAALTGVGFIFHYVPMFILGMQGMPRRYYDYLPQYETGNFLAGFGGYLLIIGMMTMFINLLMSFKQRVPAPADPWGGTTLEWKVPSPPPVHNFINKPQVEGFPYDFTKVTDQSQLRDR